MTFFLRSSSRRRLATKNATSIKKVYPLHERSITVRRDGYYRFSVIDDIENFLLTMDKVLLDIYYIYIYLDLIRCNYEMLKIEANCVYL